MEQALRRLGKDSLIYGGASVITAVLGLAIIMCATRLVNPAQYGTIELYRVTNQFLAFVIVVGMDMAQSYFFYKTEGDAGWSRRALNGALIQFRLIWGAAAVLIGAWVIPIAHAHSSTAAAIPYSQLVWALVWCWAFETSLVTLTHFRLSAKPLMFGLFSIAHTLLAGALAVAAMVFWKDPVAGYLAGFGIASVAAMAAMLVCLRREFIFWPLQTQWWGKLFKFGFPFLYSAPFLFGLQTADRWFIVKWLDRGELGIYAVGAQFAAMAGGVVTIFITAWSPLAMSKLDTEDGPHFFRSMSRLYLGGFSALAVFLTLILPLVVRWSASDAYHGVSLVARILLWVPILSGFFYLATSGVWKRQKTAWVAALMGFAFIVNIAMNFLLVPRLGIVGAALSSVAAYLALGLASLYLSERLWKIHYPFMIFAVQLAAGTAFSAGIVYLEAHQSAFVWRCLAALLGIGCILFITLRAKSEGIRHEGQLGL